MAAMAGHVVGRCSWCFSGSDSYITGCVHAASGIQASRLGLKELGRRGTFRVAVGVISLTRCSPALPCAPDSGALMMLDFAFNVYCYFVHAIHVFQH